MAIAFGGEGQSVGDVVGQDQFLLARQRRDDLHAFAQQLGDIRRFRRRWTRRVLAARLFHQRFHQLAQPPRIGQTVLQRFQ